jgi:hypothetical protein
MNTGVVEGVYSAAGIFAYMESEGILSERASATKLGEKIGDSTKVTLVDSCVNAGEIICNSGKDNENKSRIAAGIVAHTNRNITVKNCVNLGALDMPVNDDPCLVNVIMTSKAVSGSGNIYLSTLKGLGNNASAVEANALATSIADSILAYDAPAILEKIAKAKALNAEDYEAESYATLMAVCQSAEARFSGATDITTVTQKSIATLNADFDEAFEGLVKLSSGSDNDDGGDAPDVNEDENDTPDQNEGDNDTPNGNEGDNNDSGSEDGENGNEENGGSAPAPENTDDQETDAPATEPTEPTDGASEGGCGSTAGAAALMLTAVFGLGSCVKTKKD